MRTCGHAACQLTRSIKHVVSLAAEFPLVAAKILLVAMKRRDQWNFFSVGRNASSHALMKKNPRKLLLFLSERNTFTEDK
jgi:hypothetical protein